MKQNEITRRDALKRMGVVSAFIALSSVLLKETFNFPLKKEVGEIGINENNLSNEPVNPDYVCEGRCISIYYTNLDYWRRNEL